MTEHHEGNLTLTGLGNPDPAPDLGRHAYEAYCAATGGLSLVSGAQLPAWEDLAPDIRGAWAVAADAVARVILD